MERVSQLPIPNSWEWVNLGDLISVVSGVSYKKGDVQKSGIRILRGGNLSNMKVTIEEDDIFLPSQYYDQQKQVHIGDILVVASTGSKTVIGKPGFVDRDLPNTMIGAFLRICRPVTLELASFLKVLFGGEYYRKHIRDLAQGTNINNVKEEYITNLIIPLPPLAEQKRIVSKIEELIPFVEQYAAASTKLNTLNTSFPDMMKKSILQEAVQGKLVPQDPNDEPASELLKKIAEEKKRLIKEGKIKKQKSLPEITENEIPFDIPESWEWVRLGNIVSILGDGIHGTPKYDDFGEFFFVNGNNLSNGKIEIKANTKRVNKSEYEKYKKALDDSSILVSINGTIGNIAFYNNEPVMLGKSACYFNLIERKLKPYVFWLIKTDYFMKYAFAKATGTTIKNVSLQAMNNFLVPLPSIDEQERIVGRVEELIPYAEGLMRQ